MYKIMYMYIVNNCKWWIFLQDGQIKLFVEDRIYSLNNGTFRLIIS